MDATIVDAKPFPTSCQGDHFKDVKRPFWDSGDEGHMSWPYFYNTC